jgi:tRNA dimethylallyltransferase
MSETSTSSFPVLSIVGTTAVGKTDMAMAVAHELILENHETGIDVISADSRQVFKGLEVLTGADIPAEFTRTRDEKICDKDFFVHDTVRLFGVSMLEPSEEWSVGLFQTYAHGIINNSLKENRKIIIVGGTGLFHRHLFTTDPRLQVAPNQALRNEAAAMSVEALQAWLEKVDLDYFATMNNSDKNNPRRLVRAIEVGLAEMPETVAEFSAQQIHHFFLGLHAPLEIITDKITQRVAARMTSTAVDEVKTVVSSGKIFSPMVESILGFPQLQRFITKEISSSECQEEWSLKEVQYAKRQITWWKNKSDVNWFNATDPAESAAAIKFGVSVLLHGVALLNN